MDFSIRPLTENDTDALFCLTSNPKVTQFMRFETHRFRAEAEALLEEYLKHASFAILDQERFFGVFSFHPSKDAPGDMNLSFFLDQEYWNRGLAKRILKDRINYAKENQLAHSLSAYVVGENIASRRSLEACGFYVRDIKYFSDLPSGLYIYSLGL